MAEGWIIISRSITDHWVWKGEPFDKGKAWIDLIMLANYEDHKTLYKGEVITCKRGDINLSVSYLAERWGWSRHKVSDFLDALEKDKMIVQNRTVKRTVITIVNYDAHQASKDSKKGGSRTAGGQLADITKERKEIKEVNKKNIYGTYSHVKLTDQEFEKLGSEYGNDIRDKAITFLDEYCEDKKSYKHNSDYLCIRRWVIDAVRKGGKTAKATNNSFNNFGMKSDYNMDDLEKALLK